MTFPDFTHRMVGRTVVFNELSDTLHFLRAEESGIRTGSGSDRVCVGCHNPKLLEATYCISRSFAASD